MTARTASSWISVRSKPLLRPVSVRFLCVSSHGLRHFVIFCAIHLSGHKLIQVLYLERFLGGAGRN